MVILVILVSIIFVAVGFWINAKTRLCSDWMIYSGATVGVLAAIVLCIMGGFYSEKMVVDNKIALYLEQNEVIESQVLDVVESYMSYEKETFLEVSPKDALALAQTYPELMSNVLVQSQITLYINNNSSIRYLKEQKLDYKVLGWWIYFGE